MTPAQKILVQKLVTGHFLRLQQRRNKASCWYVLYDRQVNPLMKVRIDTVKNLDRFIDPKLKLWKSDRHGNMSLNLRTVRQLHGGSTIKRIYKQQLQVDGNSLYKPRSRKQVTNNENEKVNYLF